MTAWDSRIAENLDWTVTGPDIEFVFHQLILMYGRTTRLVVTLPCVRKPRA
jgi:hypothetical protein